MDTSCFSKYSDYVASEVHQLKEFPNLRELSQQTYYGGAPKHLWTKLRQPEDDLIGRQEEKSSNEDQRVGVLHQLQKRMETVSLKAFQVCKPFGLSEDNIKGEVFIVMEAYRRDLRNVIDKRMDYLKL
ncbi:unnamed protein product [Sphagnum jensenii]